jgi:hypothetical protein
MDAQTTALIITQSITFVSLVVSETLPFVPGPYQGLVQMFLAAIGAIPVPKPMAPVHSSS